MHAEGRTFQLVGGHVGLDLVNTLDWRFREGEPDELLATYGDLNSFAEQSKLLTAKQARGLARGVPSKAAHYALGAARKLREALAEVLYARMDGRRPAAGSVKTLEGFFRAARERQQLRMDGERMTWSLPEDAVAAELPVWLLALEAEKLLTSEDVERVRACAKPDCRWLFADTSKNHTRRWCDMKLCGNRMKARRFKAQLRAEA